MVPDFRKINERLEQASLDEFMPGFDKEQEWERLHSQLHPGKKRRLTPVWSIAAAVLLLVAGGWFLSHTHDGPLVAGNNVAADSNVSAIMARGVAEREHVLPAAVDTTMEKKQVTVRAVNDSNNVYAGKAIAVKKKQPASRTEDMAIRYNTKEIIRNGTPCPIQICISQTMKCPNIKPAEISSCSTLEPDESAALSYKTHDKIAKNCSLTINEIEIRSIATGEIILLNEHSTPSTAQDVFSYITRQRKGDILAGVFSDCLNKENKQGLRLNNSFGNIIIQ